MAKPEIAKTVTVSVFLIMSVPDKFIHGTFFAERKIVAFNSSLVPTLIVYKSKPDENDAQKLKPISR